MNCFTFISQPLSYNGWKKTSQEGINYIDLIRTSYTKYNPELIRQTEELYGIIYYFHKRKTGTDADNISKPIWDCLTGYTYKDDRIIKMRIAGCFAIKDDSFQELDITNIPKEVSFDLINAIASEDRDNLHVVYVEFGLLKKDFYKFCLEVSNGN
ncbi:MAG: RusA family crossover junction endodeoxyribonuclease [Bacteroidetes bacterium]|nr:RusA family crossover junction endodeoxyribonuclease [Bacteroidota bacterium]